MSDRTTSSVRTGARDGESAASGEPTGGAARPAEATQSIPTTGTARAQKAQKADAPVQPGPATVPPGVVPPGPLSHGAGASAAGPSTGAGPSLSGPSSSGPSSAAVPPPTGAGPGRPAGRPVRGKAPGKTGRGPRRAKLQLRHVDIWSAFKISLVLSIALFFIWMVAIGILYLILNGLGVFHTVNDLFGQLGSASGTKTTGKSVVTAGVVFGGAAVIGAINVILMTALCTVATFIYNMCADLVGGLEVTLSERD
jgi:hypothetical protein